MSKIIIIEKNKTITQTICSDLDELYKKCKFKKPENFIKIHEFSHSLDAMKYCLYGRLQGKSATINEYLFNGFDKKIYGACAVILTDLDNQMVDIIANDWIKYNTSKIVIDIEDEISNIFINKDKMDLHHEDKNSHEDKNEDLEEDFKLNYGSELSEDMYIYSSDDE